MSYPLFKRPKENVQEEQTYSSLVFFLILERESTFSLRSRQIRPLKLFGARRKVALRSKAYTWASILRSFDKLHEVGVSSYLTFTLCLSVFMMLELIEVVSGRLIGPKSWNRSVTIMKPIWCSPTLSTDYLGC